jgi:hypothetical protein
MGLLDRFTRPTAPVTVSAAIGPGPDPVNGAPLTLGAPANAAARAVVDYLQPAPIAEAQVRSIDAMYGAGQSGKLGNIRFGEQSSTYTGASYGGDLGPLQRFSGAQGRVGTAATMRNNGALESGLPGTSTVPGQPANQMLALLISSSGWRNPGPGGAVSSD